MKNEEKPKENLKDSNISIKDLDISTVSQHNKNLQ